MRWAIGSRSGKEARFPNGAARCRCSSTASGTGSRSALAPLLGIDDPRTSQRIEFVGGIRGPEELVRRVDRRGDGVAFALHPTSMDELMAVADASRMMPPKSTWFEPKLRSGLAVHEF